MDTNDFFENRLWNTKREAPALHIKETDNAFEAELATPGFAKKDFDVTMDNGCLNISAESSNTKEEKDDDYTRKAFSYNSFEKRL